MRKSLISLLITYLAITLVVIINWNFTNRSGSVAGLTTQAEPRQIIRGLVIPHHEIADSLINHALNQVAASGNSYSTIVIIGPNHQDDAGAWAVSASHIPNLRIDSASVAALSQADIVLDMAAFIENEHGIMVPAQFISQAFPKAQLLPLAISSKYTDTQLQELVTFLSQQLKGNSLFVLSVDMAHNQMLTEAMEHHQTVKHIFETFDYHTLAQLNDAYMDAPVPTQVFLKTLEAYQATEWRLIEESHGSLILGQPDLFGTSYLTGVFIKPAVE